MQQTWNPKMLQGKISQNNPFVGFQCSSKDGQSNMSYANINLSLAPRVSCLLYKIAWTPFWKNKQEIASRGFIFQIRVHLWWYNDIPSKCWRILPFLMPSMIQINDNLVTVAAGCLSPKQNFYQIFGNKPTRFLRWKSLSWGGYILCRYSRDWYGCFPK